MLLEATEKPIRVKLKNQPEILLKPGEPVDMPEASARQLLAKAAGKVRVVEALTTVRALVDPVRGTPHAERSSEEMGPSLRCATCRRERFWCATCSDHGQWVCGCTHLRLALQVRARPVTSPMLVLGQAVSWDSPLMGRLTGLYLGAIGRRQIEVLHPLTQQRAVIPTAWLLTEQEGDGEASR